jgi:ribosomal-protein-alanine N-acetyltransferase
LLQGLVIRELDAGDLDTVYAIEVESYPRPWTRNFFRLMAHTSRGMFLVALVGEEIVGYTVGEVDTRSNGRKLGHIMNIAVREPHRNMGVGTAMLDELERRFAEAGVVASYLEVRVSNETAQRLYAGRGYRLLRRAAGYYGDEDGYVMTKPLKHLNS